MVLGYSIAIGFLIPIWIAALAGGFILGVFMLRQFERTVLGIHVRHWMTRHAPSKFFGEDESDRDYVLRVVLEDLKRGDSSLRAWIAEDAHG